MSNQLEIDYEKQFQEDLAKATALSLEQQALEEFKRCQKYGLAYTQSVQQEAKNRNYAQIRRQQYARRDSNEITASAPRGLSLPPPQTNQPQRRHSEITQKHNQTPTTLLTDIERSKTPPASVAAENDLINFASPTATKPQNTTFEKLIEDLQKLQATNPQTALVPLAPTATAVAAAPIYGGYQTPAATALYAGTGTGMATANMQQAAQYGMTATVGAAGMQLVPFTPPPPQQKVPLTHDELQKLYSMSQPPYTAPIYGPRPIGFMPGIQGASYYRQTSPVMMPAAGAPFSAPVQYPNPFGFQQYNMSAPTTAQFNYYTHNLASNNLTSSLASNAYNLNSSVRQTLNTNLPSNVNSNNLNPTHSQPSTSSSNAASSQSNGQNNFRRHTPPARKSKQTGLDLIDLSHEDDSRVSVLEAFDPLLNENDDVTKRLNK